MTDDRQRTKANDAFVERASMNATFSTLKRTMIAGLLTAAVVVSALLLSGGTSVRTTVALVSGLFVSRLIAVRAAVKGAEAESIAEQRRWTKRLEFALIPLGFLSGIAPSFVPLSNGQATPEWFGLMLCAVAVGAANVLLGFGRSQTFVALALPLMAGAAISATLVGGELGILFAPGAVIVGAILVFDNREAGTMFRQARRLEEENQTLVSELKAANSQLQQKVNIDSLTGLSNRAGLRRHIDMIDNNSEGVEVIYIDLDGFKALNDEHGHATGDAVLAVIGERLSRVVRSHDCAARLGGDEFAVIATSCERPLALCERIRATLETPIDVGDLELELGASIGVHHAEPGDDIGRAMRLADAAMYEQKRTRHRPKVASPAGLTALSASSTANSGRSSTR